MKGGNTPNFGIVPRFLQISWQTKRALGGGLARCDDTGEIYCIVLTKTHSSTFSWLVVASRVVDGGRQVDLILLCPPRLFLQCMPMNDPL